MYTELIRAEAWRKRLESAGFRVTEAPDVVRAGAARRASPHPPGHVAHLLPVAPEPSR